MVDYVQKAAEAVVNYTKNQNNTPTEAQRNYVVSEEAKRNMTAEMRRKAEQTMQGK